MMAMEQDPRRVALVFTRVRAIFGLAMLVAPGPAGKACLGSGAGGPAARALTRMLGARDVVLGIGSLSAVKEGRHGPEWLGMSAIADGVDAAVCLFAPKLGWRARVVGVLAALFAGFGLKLARDIADERDAAASAASIVT